MFKDAFYVENEGYSCEEVQILLLDRAVTRERRIQRAKARLEKSASDS